MPLPFVKVHGAGNDFILIPDLDDTLTLQAGLTVALCDRHRGIGGDGVIRVGAAPQGGDADVFMDYRNADGSVAEMCGNGVRTVAKYVADRRVHPDSQDAPVRVGTRAGVKTVACTRGPNGLVSRCRVDMGSPVIDQIERPIQLADEQITAVTLSMGNPHAVLVVDDVGTAPVSRIGAALQDHPEFPGGINVEFIAPRDAGSITGRIWERGVGETLASGTGGAAMGVAAAVRGLTDRTVDVHLPGGVLTVEWTDSTLFVTGPAVEVGGGTLDDHWLDAIGASA